MTPFFKTLVETGLGACVGSTVDSVLSRSIFLHKSCFPYKSLGSNLCVRLAPKQCLPKAESLTGHFMTTRILIADDSRTVRHSLHGLLERHLDWKVCADAVDGTDAIAKAQQFKPGVIVLDFFMPGLTGVEAARILNFSLSQPDEARQSRSCRTYCATHKNP